MKSFTDKNGESWDLDLNIGAAMRLKSRLEIDIENAVTIDKANNPTTGGKTNGNQNRT